MKNINSFLRVEEGFEVLDLCGQNLSSVPDEVVTISEEIDKRYKEQGKRARKELQLCDNNFTSFSADDFKKINHFNFVHITSLKCKELSSDIKYLTNPMVLNFSLGDLVTLPKEIYQLTQLRRLRVNWTEIENFDESIKNLDKLVDIEVSNTPFMKSIYRIQDNNGEAENDHLKEVLRIKNILGDMGCEIIE